MFTHTLIFYQVKQVGVELHGFAFLARQHLLSLRVRGEVVLI